MRKLSGSLRSLLAPLLAVALVLGAGAGSASAVGVAQATVPSAVPFARTPQIQDGMVLALAEAGNRIVVAGTFTSVRDVEGNGGATFAQRYIFAFDPTTGAVDPTFRPTVNGVVNAVIAGPAGTVYVGGSFTLVNGAAARNLVQLSLAGGARTSFVSTPLSGAVNDLALLGNRLYVAGNFTTAGGVVHGGLATLNATTGALDPYLGVDVALHHNYPDRGTAQSAIGVARIDLSPDGSRLVAIGNFREVDGLVRDQVVMVLLQSTAPVVDPNWRTTSFEAACRSTSYDSWVRDVQFAPDGSYFAIASTGGPHFPGTPCDALATFDTPDTGQAVAPRWISYAGGDSLYSVAITGTAIYTGGHQRWMNNPLGHDGAGAGAVPRPGLAAVDPRTGVPLLWNPGRNPRGAGAWALLATSNGLYVGSDTEYIGNRQYFRPRLAYFPLAGGYALPSETAPTLPTDVYLAGRQAAQGTTGTNDVLSRYFTGSATPNADATVGNAGFQWSSARGAFMAGNTLFYGAPRSAGGYGLSKRSFDGSTFGAATEIDPYNDPVWSTVSTGSTFNGGQIIYYRGALPSFYGQLSTVTGMFFDNARIYYTMSGSPQLYYRYFSVDSGIVSESTFVAATSGFDDVAGMFLSGGHLYYATQSTGELQQVGFANGVPSGASTPAAPGPQAGGRDWRTRAMFLGPTTSPAPNTAPTASFTYSCAALKCSVDGSGSTDPGGAVQSYSWNWGEGSGSDSGVTAQHTYGAAGTYPITLTVTDNGGLTGSTTQSVSVSPAPASAVAFRAATGVSNPSASTTNPIALTVPASVQSGDGMVLMLSTNSAVTSTPPAGWNLKASQVFSNLTTQVWSRVATASDAGTPVTVTFGGPTKATLQLGAYSGTSVTDPVSVATGASDTSTSSHTTPLTTATAGSWVLSLWSDKQAAARQFTAPAAVTVRSNLAGVGNGDVAGLVADSGGPVPAGTVGGLTASVAPTVSNRGTMFTIILAPAS